LNKVVGLFDHKSTNTFPVRLYLREQLQSHRMYNRSQ
jgi:hypothetical protein